MQKIICVKWKEALQPKFEAADSFRIEGNFCDVTLRSNDGVAVKAHRIILSMGSNYFRDLFTSGMKDSSAELIDYKLIKGETLEKVVGFIYSGEMEVSTPEQIEDVTCCANFFQLDELIEECIELLSSKINDNNCLRLWRLGRECFSDQFEKRCILYILNSCDRLFQDESFLNEVQKDELETLLKEDGLKCSEERKFQAICQCTKNMANGSTEFSTMLSDFLKFVKLFSLSKEYFYSDILQNDDLIDNKDALRAIGKSAGTELVLEPKNEKIPIVSDLIKSREDLFVMQSNKLNGFSTDGDIKITLQKRNYSIRFGCTTFNNFPLICGGQNKELKSLNLCEYFNPFNKKWYNFPDIKTPRYSHQCIYIDKKIYVCGGWKDDKTRLSDVEIFDFTEEKWITGPEMKLPRSGFGLTSLHYSLYAVGGANISTIDLLDPRMSNTWNVVYNGCDGMKTRTKCVAVFNDIYCFNEEKAYIFDTRTNKIRFWGNENNYPPTKKIFNVCNIDENLYMTRYNANETKYFLYKYDFKENLINSKALLNCNKPFALIGLNCLN